MASLQLHVGMGPDPEGFHQENARRGPSDGAQSWRVLRGLGGVLRIWRILSASRSCLGFWVLFTVPFFCVEQGAQRIAVVFRMDANFNVVLPKGPENRLKST